MKVQNRAGAVTTATLIVALGIIYGDIGTSPLYVMKAIIGGRLVSDLLVYGGLSCVIWTLTLQTTLKYILLTLKADNHGEGGIFSLYALVKRYRKHLVIPTILGATTLLADGIITPPISVASAIEGLRNIHGLERLNTVPIVIAILSALFFFQRFGTSRIGSDFGRDKCDVKVEFSTLVYRFPEMSNLAREKIEDIRLYEKRYFENSTRQVFRP